MLSKNLQLFIVVRPSALALARCAPALCGSPARARCLLFWRGAAPSRRRTRGTGQGSLHSRARPTAPPGVQDACRRDGAGAPGQEGRGTATVARGGRRRRGGFVCSRARGQPLLQTRPTGAASGVGGTRAGAAGRRTVKTAVLAAQVCGARPHAGCRWTLGHRAQGPTQDAASQRAEEQSAEGDAGWASCIAAMIRVAGGGDGESLCVVVPEEVLTMADTLPPVSCPLPFLPRVCSPWSPPPCSPTTTAPA